MRHLHTAKTAKTAKTSGPADLVEAYMFLIIQ
jgi:hypothetical protein